MLAVTTPVMAQKTDLDAQEPLIVKAGEQLRNDQPREAIETVTPAIAAYDRAFANEKRRLYCSVTPGQAVAALGLAAKDKQDAVAVARSYCTALYVRAYALVDVGKVDEAEAAFKRLAELAPFNSRYIYELANVWRVGKRYDIALDGFRRAAELAEFAPDGRGTIERVTAWRQIGWIYVEQGKWEEAADMYRQCLKLDPDDQKSKDELAYIAEHRPKS